MSLAPSGHQLLIGSVPVEVTHKPIKHLHLSVVPPDGAVRISAPHGMSTDHVRAYAIGKLAWIRRQQARLAAQPAADALISTARASRPQRFFSSSRTKTTSVAPFSVVEKCWVPVLSSTKSPAL